MASLTEADYRTALEVLREAGEVDGPVPFPAPVLDALRERDAEGAAVTLRRHIERFADWVQPEEAHVRQ